MQNEEAEVSKETIEKRLALIEVVAEKERLSETKSSDLKYVEEVATLTIEKFKGELSHESKKRWLKIGFAFLLFLLVVVWLLVVIIYTGFAGFNFRGFELSDSVLIAFITSTTVSVLGLFHYVAKWLYTANEPLELPKDEPKK
jgi:hypothetical protein